LRNLTKGLKNSEEYILNLIDSISLGVVGLDLSGKISHYNSELTNLFDLEGLKKGDDIFSILLCLDQKDIKDAFQNAITEVKPQHINEKQVNIKSGEEYINLSFFPIGAEKDKVLGITLLIENVTERIRLRKQIAQYEKLSALSQLALGAAHEINNPLLGISSYLENLEEETKDEESKQEIGLVLENVYRISETIRGLLDFARPASPQFTKVNINKLIEETISFISHQPIFRKVEVEKELSSSVPNITADHNQIRQVLINMFLNAAQSMPDRGKLKVKTTKVKFKELVQIDILDTGKGISNENIKKIFDPFFTTKKTEGTGLGLSISLSYLKNHKGYISVKSKLNKGTTFSIFMPIRQKGRKTERSEETIS
jgi:signal transduction histidine kinase